VAREREPGDRLHAKLFGDVVQAVIDFLQPHRVAAALLDDARDALRILLAIAAAAAVNVIRSDPQNFGTELGVERAPVS
jgi:hypothetical protein